MRKEGGSEKEANMGEENEIFVDTMVSSEEEEDEEDIFVDTMVRSEEEEEETNKEEEDIFVDTMVSSDGEENGDDEGEETDGGGLGKQRKNNQPEAQSKARLEFPIKHSNCL